MIKRLIRKVFGINRRDDPTVLSAAQHGIARDQISNGARKVCESLQASGYAAYVVGGAVRDLLQGVKPKDFDVATDATPEQVHRVIRRSRLIGRRFKLVHALFGAETVEVSTFRAGTQDAAEPVPDHDASVDEHGRVLRDNVFGTRVQDAARRDFTINALYYDPVNETVLDYHAGVADLRRKAVRIIGDATQRYREDPVRMLRAIRFAAKLDFSIAADTRKPIGELTELLRNVPASRLFEETLKLLLSGHAVACVRKLREEGLQRGVLPILDEIAAEAQSERFLQLALAQTDRRLHEDKPISPAFLFATVLWHGVRHAWHDAMDQGARPVPAIQDVMDGVIDRHNDTLAIPRRFTATMKEIWALQPRLEANSGRRPYALLEHPRFRAAYDFLALRAESGEVSTELVDWWTRFQTASSAEREQMLLPQTAGSAPRRRRRRRPGSARPDERGISTGTAASNADQPPAEGPGALTRGDGASRGPGAH